MGYLMAAYAITLGTLFTYGLNLARERRRLDVGKSPRGSN
jgi:hypothetical protein